MGREGKLGFVGMHTSTFAKKDWRGFSDVKDN